MSTRKFESSYSKIQK